MPYELSRDSPPVTLAPYSLLPTPYALMELHTLVKRLTTGEAAAKRLSTYCVKGSLPGALPQLQITGVGPITWPIKMGTAKQIISVSQQAPFGKGLQTLVDTTVRNTFELSPDQFTITNPEWIEAIQKALVSIAPQLGLPAERLVPQVYKLLIYKNGGFFLPHRDSEKTDRMVGSLIVALPSQFRGGELTVRHQGSTERIDFADAARETSACYAAFYADCEHEVSKVRSGYRLCLAYNLVLTPEPRKKVAPAKPTDSSPAGMLADAITQWVEKKPAEPLVFALDHHYTEHGLIPDLLKGADRARAKLVMAAADKAGCRVMFCQVERHVTCSAYDEDEEDHYGYGSRSRRRHRYDDEDDEDEDEDDEIGGEASLGNYVIQEVIDEYLTGENWVDAAGKPMNIPSFGFNGDSIVSSIPLDDWKPTREEYEGFTGNAGNTLDRWYHRSAMCLWHQDQHYEVLAKESHPFAIEQLDELLQAPKQKASRKRAASAKPAPRKKRSDTSAPECLALAQAILHHWPMTKGYQYQPESLLDRPRNVFASQLAAIDDPELARELFRIAATKDPYLNLDRLVVGMCRKHGCAAFAAELTALFETEPKRLIVRNVEWLEKLALAQLDDPVGRELIPRLARHAVDQFCQPLPDRHYGADPTHAVLTLPGLLQILLSLGDDTLLKRVVDWVQAHPKRFPLETTQVPVLKTAITAWRKHDFATPALVQSWLLAVQHELQAATVQEPQPPSDWARPNDIECKCKFCQELKAILGDPTSKVGRIRAAENYRSHVLESMRKHHSDVTHGLEKIGSPHILVLTKTDGSFQRRLKRYHDEQALLNTVDELVMSPA